MGYNTAFYIHHHGSGHLMRALAIATKIKGRISFLGSDLQRYKSLIPEHIDCIDLPADVPDEDDQFYSGGPDVPALHYAPLNVAGLRNRARMITEFFFSNYPLILIVDVSVEIALLARLCGVPTVIIRQHGLRNDTAHLNAYHSASLLIAPYSKNLQSGAPQWVDDKTVFSGGFSRFPLSEEPDHEGISVEIAVMAGRGGTSLDISFVHFLAGACPDFRFHVLGIIEDGLLLPHNIILYGPIDDPSPILKKCVIIIGNAGHNTVMEVAALKKKFICIPEKRPFSEQEHKASSLAAGLGTTVVLPEVLLQTNWNNLLHQVMNTEPNWGNTINPDALQTISDAIEQLAGRLFVNTQNFD